jgi:dTDP-4-dehydrorhamnose reductase
VSTDFVFNGQQGSPYLPEQAGDPLEVHGGGLAAVLHWSDAGAASWYDVAVAVGELGLELGLLGRMAAVNPITTADYHTPAQRPSYSLLDCSETRRVLELPAVHWRHALRRLLEAVK